MSTNGKYSSRIERGLCGICGVHPARKGFKTCLPCAVRKNSRALERRAQRKANGLCAYCGKNPLYNANLCKRCALLSSESQRRWRETRKNAERN